MPNHPSNLVVMNKMVGGKEVQLVTTPQVSGARRPAVSRPGQMMPPPPVPHQQESSHLSQ